MKSINVCVLVFFGDVQTCGLREECRRDWEVGLRYGVRMNHMIIFGLIKFSFIIHILYLK